MGSPKKLRREWSRPLRPFDKVRLEYEAGLEKEYGFKKKSEIWTIQSYFKNIKRRARNIQATHDQNDEKILMNKLLRYGIAKDKFTLDDVLNLRLEDFCERRLQTIILRKGMATTANQARQIVAHRRILIGDMVVDQPNYLVDTEQEKKIRIKEKIPKSGQAPKKGQEPKPALAPTEAETRGQAPTEAEAPKAEEKPAEIAPAQSESVEAAPAKAAE
jgi:small subunit ribosomal protein S4